MLPSPTDVGVIVGRFQVHKLHEGHRNLIDTVVARHKRIVIFLAVPAWRGGYTNPLDYQTRKLMMAEYCPTAIIEPIQDQVSDEQWSKVLDGKIRELFPFSKATLYGGRDGFIRFYGGSNPTVQTLEDPRYDTESGRNSRILTAAIPLQSEDFRAGVIYGNQAIPEWIQTCVDGAVVRNNGGIFGRNESKQEVLLIRKAMEKLWRFPGGKLDPGDVSLEAAVNREVREETGVEVGAPIYVTSAKIHDWRMVRVGVGVQSALFVLPFVYGAAKGLDDAAEAMWFKLDTIGEDHMEICHRGFLIKLKEWLKTNQIGEKNESDSTDRLVQAKSL